MPKTLKITFKYSDSDQSHVETISAGSPQAYFFGREQFAGWLPDGPSPAELRNRVSANHFRIVVDDGQFRLYETSKHGSTLEQTYEKSGAVFSGEKHNEEIILRTTGTELHIAVDDDRRMIVAFSQKEDKPTKDGEDHSTGDLPPLPFTVQLGEALEKHRYAHLIGLPGSRKQKLIGLLKTHTDDRLPPNVSTLPIEVDSRFIEISASEDLWLSLARAILDATAGACEMLPSKDDGNTTRPKEAAKEIREISSDLAYKQFRSPLQLDLIFRHVFDRVRRYTRQNPLLILNHFDGLYAVLDAEMFECLRKFQTWPDLSDHMYLVVATNRSFEAIKREEDSRDHEKYVEPFTRLFRHTTIALQYEDSHLVTLLKELPKSNRPPTTDGNTRKALSRLTGNYPALLEEVAPILKAEGLIDKSGALTENLSRRRWEADKWPACKDIWNALSPDERQCLLELSQRRPPTNAAALRSLGQLGLVKQGKDGQNRIFSHIFDQAVEKLHSAVTPTGGIRPYGLHIDPHTRRVYRNGLEVMHGDSSQFAVLLKLYEKRNEIVSYAELIQATDNRYDIRQYNEDPSDARGRRLALTRMISHLCQKIDPERFYIQSKRNQGYSFVEPKGSG